MAHAARNRVAAQIGRLEPEFGAGGWVRVDAGGVDEARAVAVQPDGRIVIAGATTTPAGLFAILVMRLTRDGGLDPSFGRNGMAVFQPGTGDAIANALAVAPDGRLIAGGYAHNGRDFDFVLLRLLPNGRLDPDFGDGGITMHSAGPANDAVRSITTFADGSLLVAGAAQQPAGLDFVVARYDPNGRQEAITATAATGERDAVVAHTELDGHVSLTLLTGDRATVTHLTHDGEVQEPESHAAQIHLNGVLNAVRGITWDGPTGTPLLVAGERDGRFALARYRLDGRLDADFGQGGVAVVDMEATPAAATAAAILPDGGIVVTGHAGYDIAVARLGRSRLEEGPPPRALPTFPSVAVPPGDLLLYDTFDLPEASSFTVGAIADAEHGFDSDAFFIRTRYPAAIIFTGSSRGRAFRDARISVSGGIRGHSDGRELVIGCRDTEYGRYELFIRPDNGSYAFYRVTKDPVAPEVTRRRLAPLTTGRSTAVFGAGRANRIDLACIGNQFAAAANGAPLFVITDPDCWCEAGEVALGVSSARYGDSEALFNDLVVTAP